MKPYSYPWFTGEKLSHEKAKFLPTFTQLISSRSRTCDPKETGVLGSLSHLLLLAFNVVGIHKALSYKSCLGWARSYMVIIQRNPLEVHKLVTLATVIIRVHKTDVRGRRGLPRRASLYKCPVVRADFLYTQDNIGITYKEI